MIDRIAFALSLIGLVLSVAGGNTTAACFALMAATANFQLIVGQRGRYQ